jgi:hypothetical protein
MSARPTVNSFEIFGGSGKIYVDLFHGFAFLETGKVSKARKILHPFDSSVKQFASAAFNLARRAIQSESAYPGLRQLVKNFYRAIIMPAEAINAARVRDRLVHLAGSAKLQDHLLINK